MPASAAPTTITPGWLARRSLNAGTRAVYQLLHDQDQRVLLAQFDHRDGPLTLVAARGQRVAELHELLDDELDDASDRDTLTLSDTAAQRARTVDADQRHALQRVAATARRLMSRHRRSVLVVGVNDTAPEPLLLVVACEDEATRIAAAVLDRGMVDPD